MNIAMWLLPILGGLIGWVTNYFAIILLFRPHNAIRIPLLGYSIQGLLPKYRDELAHSVGEILEKEFVSVKDIFMTLSEEESKEDLLNVILHTASRRIDQKLPRFIPDNLRATLKDYITSFLSTEISSIFDEALSKLEEYLSEKISIQELVENKLKLLNMDELEALVVKVAARELKHIEIIGGVLGFLIGLIQMALAFFLM